MHLRFALFALLSLALFIVNPTFAADPAPAGAGDMQGMMDGPHKGHGKRCGMHGDHGGMKCKHKMRGMPLMIPHLPPGNEKLQLQMQAEIMQKVGEITAKYAAQLK
jgi:hypothetical protein